MNTELLTSISTMVRSACRSPSNVFGFGIWTHHIRPMIETAKALAPLHNADTELTLLCVLLHDFAGISNEAWVEQHHVHGAEEAHRILSAKAYPPDRIAIVEDAIRSHRGSVPGTRSTNEALCLADCDAISHIEQFPSLFYVIYKERSRSIADGAEWVTGKLERDWNKLSPIGRTYIGETYRGLAEALAAARAASRWTGDEDPSWTEP